MRRTGRTAFETVWIVGNTSPWIYVRLAQPQCRLVNSADARTRLPGSHQNRTTFNPAQPECLHTRLVRHQQTVLPGTLRQRCDKRGDSYLFTQCDGFFTYNSPPRAQRRSIRKNHEHSLCARSRSIAAHQGISRQQMGDASTSRTTATMPALIPCTWAQNTRD
jgi:hypothetical protein